MVNKIVTFSTEVPQKNNLIVYSDLNLTGKPASIANNSSQNNNKARFKLDKNINVNAIKQSIKNIFSWMPGERIINPEFGSNLRSYLYQGITTYNIESIIAEVQHCFSAWEPRAELVSVRDVSNIEDVDDNTVQLEIIYTIPSLSPEQYSYTIEMRKSV